MIKVQIKKIKEVKTPSYAHKGDAGIDLYAAENYVLKPMETKVIKTGVCMAIPQGYAGLIWDRSGLAAKNSIHTMAGVVDSGYRGEIGTVLKNLSDQNFEITKNMRIAQMLIQPIANVTIEEKDSLDETNRNEGGFGSTGTH